MSIKSKLLMQRQNGDTLVEVLIVLAVLGLALGISYATASKSLLATRAAQENTQATQLIQAQVERLYALAPNPITGPADQYIFSNRPAPFCISATNKIVALTHADCNPPPAPYKISVLYCTGNSDPTCAGHGSDDTFILTATWENIRGQGNDSVQISYRIHQSVPGGNPVGGGPTECNDNKDNDFDGTVDFDGSYLGPGSEDPSCGGDPNGVSEI